MIPGYIRKIYFFILNPLAHLNGMFYRYFRCPYSGLLVQLGPGHDRYIDGWLNVDINCVTAKIDLWANFEYGLPFRDGSVKAFYSFHVIEHISYDRVLYVFKEMYRALEPGGVLRIGVPDSGNAARAFVDNNLVWFERQFHNFPRAHKSIGGKLANFVLCVNEHKQLFDFSFIQELLQQAGFGEVVRKEAFATDYPETYNKAVLDKEYESTPELPHTLVVEVKK